MNEALSVFLTGIVGVFAGMTLLYLTVRLNALVAGRIEARLAPAGEPAPESAERAPELTGAARTRDTSETPGTPEAPATPKTPGTSGAPESPDSGQA